MELIQFQTPALVLAKSGSKIFITIIVIIFILGLAGWIFWKIKPKEEQKK